MAASPAGGSEPGSAHSCNTLVEGLRYLVEQVPSPKQVALTDAQMAAVMASMEAAQISKPTLAKLRKQFESACRAIKPEEGTPDDHNVHTPPARSPFFESPLFHVATPTPTEHPVHPPAPLVPVKSEPVEAQSSGNSLARPPALAKMPKHPRASAVQVPGASFCSVGTCINLMRHPSMQHLDQHSWCDIHSA